MPNKSRSKANSLHQFLYYRSSSKLRTSWAYVLGLLGVFVRCLDTGAVFDSGGTKIFAGTVFRGRGSVSSNLSLECGGADVRACVFMESETNFPQKQYCIHRIRSDI